jgi:hypothetical protein
LKVGRALNVMILYIGQTPLCSRLKLNRDDFRHSSSFFLGENIPAGIAEVVHSPALKNSLEEEYTERQKGSNKYFALIKIPGKTAFIATLPKPYNSQLPDTNKVVTASNCEQNSDNVGYQEVTMPVTPVTKREQAVKALNEGMSKANVIKEVWGMKGKYYGEGLKLWDNLEISTETGQE